MNKYKVLLLFIHTIFYLNNNQLVLLNITSKLSLILNSLCYRLLLPKTLLKLNYLLTSYSLGSYPYLTFDKKSIFLEKHTVFNIKLINVDILVTTVRGCSP